MLLKLSFALEDKDKLACAYQRKKLIGKALQICDNFQHKHAWVSAFIIAAHQYSMELDKILKKLEEKKLALQSAQNAYQIMHEKNVIIKTWVMQKIAVRLAPLGFTALFSMIQNAFFFCHSFFKSGA